MKNLGTKVDNSVAERFCELCNQEGKSVSENLREMIVQWIEATEEGQEFADKPNMLRS